MSFCVFFMCVHVDSVCAFYVNFHMCVCVWFFFFAYTAHMHDFVCLHHALLLCVCASASANHNGPFRILTPSFHHIVSQSQLADESQVPAGLTQNSRERKKKEKKEKILTRLCHVLCFQFFSLKPLVHPSNPPHTFQTPESSLCP